MSTRQPVTDPDILRRLNDPNDGVILAPNIPARQKQREIQLKNEAIQLDRIIEERQQRGEQREIAAQRRRAERSIAVLEEQEARTKNLLDNPGLTSISGPVQGLLPASAFSVPALLGDSDPLDAFADWEAVRSPAGLAELGNLRAQSETGGAVGQVSNYEQRLLQDAAGQFTNRLQSDESFKEAVQKYYDRIVKTKERLIRDYEESYGARYSSREPTNRSGPGALGQISNTEQELSQTGSVQLGGRTFRRVSPSGEQR
jgi:hypothetical protein